MNDLVKELTSMNEMRASLQDSLSRELDAIRSDLDTLAVPGGRVASLDTDLGQTSYEIGILEQLKQITTSSKDPKELAKRIASLVNSLEGEAMRSPVRRAMEHTVPLMPPVIFHRIPKLTLPLVNMAAIEEAEKAEAESAGLEGFLDNIFSNDKIYDDVIRKLRKQVIALNSRNVMLESNLDLAESEVQYWRKSYSHDKPLAARSEKTVIGKGLPPPAPGGARTISVSAWKLSISKFVGSIDQFLLMRVLFHWKTYLYQKRAGELEDS